MEDVMDDMVDLQEAMNERDEMMKVSSSKKQMRYEE
jgi:hypothetical protein